MPQIPPVTKALMLICTALFCVQLLFGFWVEALFALWPLGGGLGGGSFMPWQLITYAFLHGSMGHLFFNMLAVFMFGAPLEQTWGEKRFLLYYLVCVAGAGVCQLLVGTLLENPATVLGASGGVFGLLLAYGMLFPNQRVMLLFPPIPMKARTFVIVFGAIELMLGATGWQPGVAHFAHLGGMLFGWLVIRYWRGQPPFGGNRRKRPPLRSV